MARLETCSGYLDEVHSGSAEGKLGKLFWSAIACKRIVLCFGPLDDVEPDGWIFEPYVKVIHRTSFLNNLAELSKLLQFDLVEAACHAQGIAYDDVENADEFVNHF